MKTEAGRVGFFPGSFDPITKGHLDMIRRASRLVDRLYIGVLVNNSKKSLFSEEERVNMIRLCTSEIPNVEVITSSGMTVDCCRKIGASMMFRGLRGVTDFDYELGIAQINQRLYPETETVFLMTDPALSFVSSSAVRELGRYGADLSPYLPDCLIPLVKQKFETQGTSPRDI